jgi:hypothetical protein
MPRVGPNASRLLLLAQKDAGKPLRDCVALCVSTAGLPSASEIPADIFVESPQILCDCRQDHKDQKFPQEFRVAMAACWFDLESAHS